MFLVDEIGHKCTQNCVVLKACPNISIVLEQICVFQISFIAERLYLLQNNTLKIKHNLSIICNEMVSDQENLLYHIKVCCLSHCKENKRITVLSVELHIFIMQKQTSNLHLQTSPGMTNASCNTLPRRYFNKNTHTYILPSSSRWHFNNEG